MPSAALETNSDQSKSITSPSQENFGQLIDFYRFLNPRDALGKFKLPTRPKEFKEGQEFTLLFDTYISSTLSGQKIIKELFNKQLPYRGLGYQTAYIDATGKGTFLDKEYWTTKSSKPSNGEPPAGESAAGEQIVSENYYQNLCTTSGDPPVVPATINVFRAPFLSDARKNVDEISLFLNHIPSYFASQMVPYFDLEMQMPRHPGDQVLDKDTRKIVETYLDRPSLIRFLNGSTVSGELPEVDKTIMHTLNVPVAHKQAAKGKSIGPTTESEEVYISGMEMFTTPQTLTNMLTLKENGKSRLNDVKPFLPPATLVNATITQTPTGINMTHTAGVEMIIHDKARLAEFSEFLRGQAGSADITFWITYGWLAPRGAGDDDVYAKFINETMLVKRAFSVKNVSYSFDALGQVSVKLDLITKSVNTSEYGRIDTLGNKATAALKNIPRLISEIKRTKSVMAGAGAKQREAAAAFSRAESDDATANLAPANIYTIIEMAESGIIEPTMDRGEIIKIIKAEGIRNQEEKPFNEKVQRFLEVLLELYGYDNTAKMPSLKAKIVADANEFAASKFDSLRRSGEDPFLPDDRTVKVKDANGNTTLEERIFGLDLVQALKDYDEEGKPKEQPTNTGGGKGYYNPCPGKDGRSDLWKINDFWGKYQAKISQLSQRNKDKKISVEVPGYGLLTEAQVQECFNVESSNMKSCCEKHNRDPIGKPGAGSTKPYDGKGIKFKKENDPSSRPHPERDRRQRAASEAAATRAAETTRNDAIGDAFGGSGGGA